MRYIGTHLKQNDIQTWKPRDWYRVTRAPFCISRLMILTFPFNAARWSAVNPSQSDSLMMLGPSLLSNSRRQVL